MLKQLGIYMLIKVLFIIIAGLFWYFVLLVLLWQRNYIGAVSYLTLVAITYFISGFIYKLLPEDFGKV